MAESRKGILTPEQEVTLEKVLKFNNKLAEVIDGPAIQLIDNQGLERAKAKILEKNPEAEELLYEIVDILMDGIATLANEPV